MTKEEAGRPLRALQVVSHMDRGGAETMLMNYYRQLDREVLQFDFLVHSSHHGHYDDEITEMGGRMFRVRSPGTQGPVAYVREVTNTIRRNGPFGAVHTHTDASGALACVAARLAGIDRRIIHSHSTAPTRETVLRCLSFQEAVLKLVIRGAATHYCACGRDASTYLFGRRLASRPGRVAVLPNAVDLAPFEEAWAMERSQIRAELAVPAGCAAIGHVASFRPPKNHRFLIRLAGHLRTCGMSFILFLVGDGPLRRDIEEQAKAEGLIDVVRFLGLRSDVPRFLRALDVFLLPSLFEGLPVALIEAQAAGVPCVVSDAISAEADLGLGLFHQLDAGSPEGLWGSEIGRVLGEGQRVSLRQVRYALGRRGFDVRKNLAILYRLYGVRAPGLGGL